MVSKAYRQRFCVAGLTLAVGACAAPQAPPPRAAPVVPPARPIVDTNPSVASVIGQTADRLQAMFGKPKLEIEEGYARKLQFSNASCVLDAYLYPPATGRDPTVTHVDTRLPDGRDYDPAACIAALTQRQP